MERLDLGVDPSFDPNGDSIPPVNINEYPAIKRHLDQYTTALERRLDKGKTAYHLRSCAYTEDFSKQKIAWGEISDKTKFALDYDGVFSVEATAFLMTGESLPFLLCFFNSKLSEYYFSQIGTTTGVGTVRWKKYKIETFPIPKLNAIQQESFVELALRVAQKKTIGVDTSLDGLERKSKN